MPTLEFLKIKGIMMKRWKGLLSACLLVLSALFMAGCQESEPKEEKVIDIKAPGVDIEVNSSEDGASVDVEAPDAKE